MTTTMTIHVNLPGAGPVPVTYTERGSGHPFLVLHGGGGPATVEPYADALAAARPARVITPTHPGFAGTPRPEGLSSIGQLAQLYLAFLEALDLADVTVVGSSIGGWIAAETAVAGPARVSSHVLLNAVGLVIDGHPVVDVFGLTPAEIAALSFADPETYAVDPSTLPPAAREAMAGNMTSLEVYAGRAMADPTLADRLSGATSPTLVVWGEADRIVHAAVGRAYADLVADGRFVMLRGAGHLPQVEARDELVRLVWDFADEHAANRPDELPQREHPDQPDHTDGRLVAGTQPPVHHWR